MPDQQLLAQLGQQFYETEKSKGFYAEYMQVRDIIRVHGSLHDEWFLEMIWMNHRLMLIVSELAEGTEAIRNRNFSCAPKSGGLGEELADTQIRLAGMWHHLKHDIQVMAESFDETVQGKAAYNKNRPHKHGRQG